MKIHQMKEQSIEERLREVQIMTNCGPVVNSARTKLCTVSPRLLDSILSLFFICPLVVGYWRGCWQLMDYYLYPNDKEYSAFASLSFGIGCALIFGIFQDSFIKLFDPNKRYKIFFVGSRIYSVIYSISCVNHWRGVWMVWDVYTGASWISGFTSAGIGLICLGLTGGLKNIVNTPPFVVVIDCPDEFFKVEGQFGVKGKHICLFVIDMVFTVVFTGSLIVFVWRGLWVVLDRRLFPDSELYSAWSSLAIGVIISSLCYTGELILISFGFGKVRKGICKTIVEDIFYTVCFVGAVNIWRGVWMILNIYLYSERPILSNWISSLSGNLILLLFYTGNSLFVRGAQLDGSQEGAKGIALPIHYLRFFYQKYYKRKQNTKIDPTSSLTVENGGMQCDKTLDDKGSEKQQKY